MCIFFLTVLFVVGMGYDLMFTCDFFLWVATVSTSVSMSFVVLVHWRIGF